MLAYSSRTCLRSIVRRSVRSNVNLTATRSYTQAAGAKTTISATSPAEPSAQAIKALTTELDKTIPRFDIEANQIRILQSPKEFYETLKNKIRNAEDRIFLATLYIGKDEHELIDVLSQALKDKPRLKVFILTDFVRGTREYPKPSCWTLLSKLKDQYPDRVDCRMWQTPNLLGFVKSCIPTRINEGWGLQHMKLYGFDDEVIVSVANLSSDYFTNRQDRYHLISCRDITNYYWAVVKSISKGANIVDVTKYGDTRDLDTRDAYDFGGTKKAFVQNATIVMQKLKDDYKHWTVQHANPKADTQIYPLLQVTPLSEPDVSTELPTLRLLLRALLTKRFAGSSWMFTAGYFNMTPEVQQLLLKSKPKEGIVVAASPWANGFYGSKGISSMLPAAYTFMARQFLSATERMKVSDSIKLKEWRLGTVNEPGGWSYHAKGLWITLPEQKDPSISIIGSSNYTKRSYSLDIEANALVVTRNPDLQKRLGQEQTWLQKHAAEVTQRDFEKTERRVGLHVRIAMWIVTLVGGAL